MGAALAGVGGLFGVWLLFWPVPTQVEGRGVLIYPDNAGILNARPGGQVGGEGGESRLDIVRVQFVRP